MYRGLSILDRTVRDVLLGNDVWAAAWRVRRRTTWMWGESALSTEGSTCKGPDMQGQLVCPRNFRAVRGAGAQWGGRKVGRTGSPKELCNLSPGRWWGQKENGTFQATWGVWLLLWVKLAANENVEQRGDMILQDLSGCCVKNAL